MSQSNIHASKFKEALNEIHACLKYDNNVEVYGFADKYHELSRDDIEELLTYADYEQKKYDWLEEENLEYDEEEFNELLTHTTYEAETKKIHYLFDMEKLIKNTFGHGTSLNCLGKLMFYLTDIYAEKFGDHGEVKRVIIYSDCLI